MTGLALPPGYTLDQPSPIPDSPDQSPPASGLAVPEGYTLDVSSKGDRLPMAAGAVPHAMPADSVQQGPADAPDQGALDAATNSLGNALSFNFMDEAVAHAAAALDPVADLFRTNPIGGTYDERVARHEASQRAMDAAAEAQHPTASTGGRIAAIAAVAPRAVAGLVAPVLRSATMGERVANAAIGAAKGAAAGAGYSALSGYGAGEGGVGNRIGSAIDAAPSGALWGGLLGGSIGAVSRVPAGPLPPSGRDVAAAGQRVGVPLPRFLASDSPAVRQAGGIAKSLPFFGTRMVDAARQTAADFAGAKTRIAEGYGGGVAATPASAGAGVRNALEDWIGPTTKGVLTNEYNAVDRLVNQTVTTPLNNTRFASAAIEARSRNAGLPPGGAVKIVQQALSAPGGLNYQGIKDLRTRVGEIIGTPSLQTPDMDMQQMRQIYGALTKDLRTSTAVAGGPAAQAQFDRANQLNARVETRRNELAQILGINKPLSPEAVFDAVVQKAGSASSADIAALTKVKKVMPAAAWDGVASGVVDRLGYSPAIGDVSLDRFLTGYNKLSKAGRGLLFGNQPGLASALDDLATIAGRSKQIATYANPSGTGQTNAGLAVLYSAFNPAQWLHIAGATIGGHFLTRALTRPATVRALTGWARVWDQVNRGSRAGVQPGSLHQSLTFVARRFASELGTQFGWGVDRVNSLVNALQGGAPEADHQAKEHQN